ncbi:MAG: ABC transporter ATP-binding protein [Candidatus Methanomethylophilaceae archaeon]|nr:ABC transporter ATP-binding protein [Candidatus Methanomethylophilaceae archaeon]
MLGQIWLDITIPQYMNTITDAFLLDDNDVVVRYAWEMLLCAIGSLALAIIIGYLFANVSAAVGRNARKAEFDKVQEFSIQDINRFSASSLITRSTNDITQIQNFIARGLMAALRCPIITVWALMMIYGSSLEWTGVTLAGVAVLLVVMYVSLHYARIKFERIQWLTDGVNRATKENVDGIRVIRAYNAERYQEKRFSDATDELMANNISAVKIMAPVFPISRSVMNFVILGIYWVGAGVISAAGTTDEQLMLFSDMIVFTSYATMVLSSFLIMFGIMRMVPRTMVGMRRVEEVVDTVPSVASGTLTDIADKGAVEFDNVSFTYPGSEHPSLEDISFSIGQGQVLAIVGSTGSGKSTLVNLIARFYDADSGKVSVGGSDVKDYDLKVLRGQLGYVSQNAIIFSGPIGRNVNYGAGSELRTEEDVRRALRIAQAESFVDELPEGTESHISQHGKNLSGGQKQRVSIARAVCRDPDILILDDAFSALDFKTDLNLRSSLRREMKGTTLIMVAQRVGTVKDADEIIVLDKGRIVGRGRHEDLLRDCPVYLDMARSQMVEGTV